MKKLFLCAALPVLLGACATGPETNTGASVREEKDFVTGSNLPRKNRMGGDNVNKMTAEEFARTQTTSGSGAPSPAQ